MLQRTGLPFTSLRPVYVYGPLNYKCEHVPCHLEQGSDGGKWGGGIGLDFRL
jgi:nucleoside-diphosphate-sugar epimerase